MTYALITIGLAAFLYGMRFLLKVYKIGVYDIGDDELDAPLEPLNAPYSPSQPEDGLSGALDFSTPARAFHSTRVLCDEMGLPMRRTVVVNGASYFPKDIICACIFQESEFLLNPRPNQNKDTETGKVWSTDWGIVQINDYWNIGKGKPFPSVEYVLANPEACVRFMISMYQAGKLKLWSSYVTGAYKKHLPKTSRMWKLAAVDSATKPL